MWTNFHICQTIVRMKNTPMGSLIPSSNWMRSSDKQVSLRKSCPRGVLKVFKYPLQNGITTLSPRCISIAIWTRSKMNKGYESLSQGIKTFPHMKDLAPNLTIWKNFLNVHRIIWSSSAHQAFSKCLVTSIFLRPNQVSSPIYYKSLIDHIDNFDGHGFSHFLPFVAWLPWSAQKCWILEQSQTTTWKLRCMTFAFH
jgi:hypothetical protein